MTEEPPSIGSISAPTIDVTLLDPAWQDAGFDAEAKTRHAALVTLSYCHRHQPHALPAPLERLEVSLVLADDEEVRDLNRQYRGQDKATNVLSFAEAESLAEQAPEAPWLLGDVVLARETIFAEATQQGKATADHLAHLVTHGLLHLLGYDHESESEAEAMEELERRILAELSIGDPYAWRGGLEVAS